MKELENNILEDVSEEKEILYQQERELKRYNISSIILMIISFALYCVMVGFITVLAVDYLTASVDDRAVIKFIYIIFGLILMGFGFGGASVGIAITGIILTANRRDKGAKRWRLIIFIILSVLPIITEIVFTSFI